MNRQMAFAFLLTFFIAVLSSPARSEVLADSGFRPEPNGFSFENWGGKDYPDSVLTADDALFLFGEQACARIKDDSCVPIPGAKLWIAEMNRSTEGGHCEGMAALSASFFTENDSVTEYGAPEAFQLKPTNADLMRTISTYFTTQSLEPVQSATSASRSWSLQKIVDSLVTTFKSGKDFPTLGIYSDDGGHAVTPYSVESTGTGLYRINIYDNNYPGAEKYIDIDVENDHWVYAGGALNPSEDPQPWEGGSGSMDITPLSVRNEPLRCPFCAPPSAKKPKSPSSTKPKPSSASAGAGAPARRPGPARKPGAIADNYSVVTPNRCSEVQVSGKKSKKRLRMVNGKVDNQIVGASMRSLRGSRGCNVSLPHGEEYDVSLAHDGRPSRLPSSSLSIFGSGKAWSIENVVLRPGAVELFSVSAKAFIYTAGSKQKPTLRIADDTDSRNSYYEVSGFEISQGRAIAANEDASGRMAFSDDDPAMDNFDVHAEVVGDDDTYSHDFNDVDTGDNGQALFDINDDGELDMGLDDDSDGQTDDVDKDDDNDGQTDDIDSDDDNDGSPDVDDPDDSSDSDGANDTSDGDNSAATSDDSADEGTDVEDKASASDDDDASEDEPADPADTDTSDASDEEDADSADDSSDASDDADGADDSSDSADDSDNADESDESDESDDSADDDSGEDASAMEDDSDSGSEGDDSGER